MSALYELVQNSEFVEEMYQTDAKEFWYRSLTVLQSLFYEACDRPSKPQNLAGLVLTHNPNAIPYSPPASFQTWVFTAKQSSLLNTKSFPTDQIHSITIDAGNPANHEWFCIAIASTFNMLLIDSGSHHSCLFSLHPQPISQAIAHLTAHLRQPEQRQELESQFAQFKLQEPIYATVSRLYTIMLSQPISRELPVPEIQEVDIIKSLTHEVKTPLTTIRTLAQSLLRRKDIVKAVKPRIERIVVECTEQIDRFGLIFEAAQLATSPVPLESTSILEILSQNTERWQMQAERRQLSMEIITPESIAPIRSNSKLLAQLLTGIIDRLVRSLPSGSKIALTAATAGDHLKLQFQSRLGSIGEDEYPMLKSVGQWLMLQPETGTLSLSLPITKALFQSLGGKLTVRLHPTATGYDGEILTIFLPFANANQ
ncbi:histidine kinase [Thalassoporum mexicanum PCC 7367]|uniref:sensor histidine kinase n=1 Tax=Thalassoporum mexicanum TaxID=3457544 RepID=UPI00029FEF2C|nr:HAMP domain-containing histidine kinase [Pseudanabaena sp. PCC 7367]AFY69610.1 histidine kinase [Pseudanabaena sp. PCC 7367]